MFGKRRQRQGKRTPRSIHRRASRSYAQSPFRPWLETLESRVVPTTTVTPGPNINLSQKTGNQNNASITVNPTDAKNIAVFSNDESVVTGGLFEAYTTDGKNYTRVDILGKSAAPPAAPSNPQATFDSFGNLFVTYVDTSGNVDVVTSKDGGATFSLMKTFADGKADQPSIATGFGSVWISYRDNKTNIAAAGAKVTGLGAFGAFAVPQEAPGSANGDYGDIIVGPNGQVVVTYQHSDSKLGPDAIFTNIDQDGLGPGQFGQQRVATSVNVGGADTGVFASGNTRGIDAEASLGYDSSTGPHRGRLYLVYADSTKVGSESTNIFERFSDDNGASWSSAIKVNDDTSGNSHFLPSVAVDQSTGNVAVAWYDDRNSLFDDTTQLFASASVDGGQSFLANVQVSKGTSNAFSSTSPRGFGDYLVDKGAFANGVFYPVWADNSNSTNDNPDSQFDLYTSAVTLVFVNSPPVITQFTIDASVATENGPPIHASGQFTDPDPGQGHTVTINWGDGTPNSQIILGAGVSSFGPVAHSFPEESGVNPFTVTATVSDDQAATSKAATAGTVKVSDAALSGMTQGVTPGPSRVVSGVIASFTDADTGGVVPDYSATIDWGDNSTTKGTVTANGSGGFNVNGSHGYVIGDYTIKVTVNDAGGASTMISEPVHVPKQGILATGADAGGGPQVTVYDMSNGTLIGSFYAYAKEFGGGVRVGLGDFDHDGDQDIVTAPGPSGGPDIRVYDGTSFSLINEFFAFDPRFLGGVNLAVADVNNDGTPDIITAADAGGGPEVKVFSGKDKTILYDFYAYDPNFQGGVRVAAGDINKDGKADIIAAPGKSGGPDIRVWSGATGLKLQEFMAFDSTFLGGVYVAAGDVNGDGFSDVIVGQGQGGQPLINIFSGRDETLLHQNFMPYDSSVSNGVRVGTMGISPGASAEIVTSVGPGPSQKVEVFDGQTLQQLDSFFAYDPAFRGGVFVGGH